MQNALARNCKQVDGFIFVHLTAGVGCKDDDSIGKTYFFVGVVIAEAACIQNLQEQVDDVEVRLFDFVK